MIVENLVHTKRDLGRALACGDVTIHKWCRKVGFPGGLSGPWDPSICAAWMQERAQNTDEGGAARSPVQRLTEGNKALKLREEVRRLKIKNDQLESLLYERLKVDRQVAELVLRVKTRLEAFPDEMEMTFPTETRAQNKADFAHKIALELKQMSQWRLET